jgi:hypothetical protein
MGFLESVATLLGSTIFGLLIFVLAARLAAADEPWHWQLSLCTLPTAGQTV